MDNDLKKLLGILAVATVILVITKPKGLFGKKSISKNLAIPEKADNKDKLYEDSIIAIKAMRDAIKDNVPTATIEELNREIQSMYNVKVFQDKATAKLYTCNREGDKIAQEG